MLKTLKKPLIIFGKSLLFFVLFVLTYLLMAFTLPKITIDKEDISKEEMDIYILSNGVHTDIVVPVKNEIVDWTKWVKYENTVSKDTTPQFLAMGWGDKGFYLETPTWADLKASVAFKAAFGLSTTAIHATFYKEMKEGTQCKKIRISKEQYKKLVEYISSSFQIENDQSINIKTNANYGKYDAFYEANGSYSMVKTCNTWANNALKHSGQRCCFWTPFDKGIFEKYN
jgi:uncharacterized protein (TIGR02117 family)